jgi:hypothetical protein
MWRCSVLLCAVGVSGCGGGDRVIRDPVPSTAQRQAAIAPSIAEHPTTVEPSASDGTVMEGLKAAWQLTLPSGWMGGSYDQIAQVSARASDERIRSLSKALLEEARNLDAVAIHVDVRRPDKVTILRIDVIDFEGELDWQVFANAKARLHRGMRGELIMEADVVAGGRSAREAILTFTRADGAVSFESIWLVPLPNGRKHLFRLTTLGAVFGERYVEFQNMMASLRYR